MIVPVKNLLSTSSNSIDLCLEDAEVKSHWLIAFGFWPEYPCTSLISFATMRIVFNGSCLDSSHSPLYFSFVRNFCSNRYLLIVSSYGRLIIPFQFSHWSINVCHEYPDSFSYILRTDDRFCVFSYNSHFFLCKRCERSFQVIGYLLKY